LESLKIKKDICIVGSGFCGYAAYKELSAHKLDLILVEGGKVKTPLNKNEQNNYKLSNNEYIQSVRKKRIKNNIEPSFRERKFTLGGSSECWTGWIKPLEKSTLENCFANLPNQIWKDIEINKYKDKVLELLNSPIKDFSYLKNIQNLGINLPKLSQNFEYTTYAWAEKPLRIKNYWKKKLIKDIKNPNINDDQNVICGFSLCDYKSKSDQIISLEFEDRKKNKLVIESKFFMFCMGGIENAKFVKKILSQNRSIQKKSKQIIGNFQEHPHLYHIATFNKGRVKIPEILINPIKINPNKSTFTKKGSLKISFKISEGKGTPSASIEIVENQQNIFEQSKNILRTIKGRTYLPNSDYKIVMRCEQTPNKRSKLTFSSPKNFLNWDILETDFIYYSNYLKRFGSYLLLNGYANDFRLTEPSKDNIAFPKEVIGGSHHMGTVPFLKSEELITKKFFLKDYKNLYVVGTSAFPLSGFENPTHAAMAISLIASEDIINKSKKIKP
tara:strand:- start:9159 stop:10658 length:1500 start_codon:yes stop_codon:yes gene_type:complete